MESDRTGWLNIAINGLLAFIAIVGVWFGCVSNRRAEQMFGSEIRPLIQDRPYEFQVVQTEEGPSWWTKLEVVNYSGFDAYEVTFDLKYGENGWLVEWFKADKQRAEKKRERGETLTDNDRESLEFKPIVFSTIRSGHSERIERTWRGAPSKEGFCKENGDAVPVLVRTTWKNEKRHTFERVRKYLLTCTASEDGRAFTFIPGEIVASEE